MKLGQKTIIWVMLILLLVSAPVGFILSHALDRKDVATPGDAISEEVIIITEEIITEVTTEEVTTTEKIVTEAPITEASVIITEEITSEETGDGSDATYEASSFKSIGVIEWNGKKWTWYSQKVLPGGSLDIPGRYIDEDDFVCDEDGYIVLASYDYEKGIVLDTPFGRKGKVYDYCPTSGIIDVYTNY